MSITFQFHIKLSLQFLLFSHDFLCVRGSDCSQDAWRGAARFAAGQENMQK